LTTGVLFITIYLGIASTEKPPTAAHVLAGPDAREYAKVNRNESDDQISTSPLT
jgi:hypothetical protein